MNDLFVPNAYDFDVHNNELTLKPVARLFHLTDIDRGKRLLTYIKKNHISTLVCDLTQVQKLDANAESLLYQITLYFATDIQKSLRVQADSQSNVQNRLISNLYKLNTKLQLEFLTE